MSTKLRADVAFTNRNGTIKHINTDKDGGVDGGKKLRNDLKIDCLVPAEFLDALLALAPGAFTEHVYRLGSWMFITNLQLNVEFEDCEIVLHRLDDMRLSCRARRFEISLMQDRQAALTFSVQVHPEKDVAGEIQQLFKDDLLISFEARQRELPLDHAGTAAKEPDQVSLE